MKRHRGSGFRRRNFLASAVAAPLILATGGLLPAALAVVLTLLGVIWQSKNIAKWAGVLPIADRGPLG